METSFHPSLMLVALLANYPLSHYSPTFTWSPAFIHPFYPFQFLAAQGEQLWAAFLFFCAFTFWFQFYRCFFWLCISEINLCYLYSAVIKRGAHLFCAFNDNMGGGGWWI